MLINTPIRLQAFLEARGHAPHLSANSVCITVGDADAPHTAAFTFLENELRITCQIAVLGDFAENQLAHFCLAALDANMQISPYAFAIIGASEGESEVSHCPVVLTDTLLTEDLNDVEIAFSLDKLLEALTHGKDIIAAGHAPAAH